MKNVNYLLLILLSIFITSCSNISKNNVDDKTITLNNKTYFHVSIDKLGTKFVPDANLYYPTNSKKNNEEGKVITRVFIDENGVVEDVRLMQSSSYARLDRAAMEISKRYRFNSCFKDNQKVNCYVNLQLTFNLKN